MKKIINVFATMLAVITMASCDSLNPSERLMVGKWYCPLSNKDWSGEQYDTYNEDKTCVSHGTIRLVKEISEGVQEIVTFSFSTKGTWSINDKIETENTTDADIKIEDVSFQGENLTDDRNIIRETIDSEKKRLYYDLVIPLKKELMGKDSARIITLNETTCVTVDKDGEKTESRKVSE